MGPNYIDDIDCGSFFDHIDDLIDFPPENEPPFGSASVTDFCDNFPSIWTGAADDLPGSDPLFPAGNTNSASDLSAELAVPYEDIIQLEWLSTFVEDSFSGGGMTINNNDNTSSFNSASPVSVLESSSSSSCSGGKTIPHGPHRAARSKRPRPATFKPRPAMHLNSPTSSTITHGPIFLSDSENMADPNLMKIPKPVGTEQKKKKKIKVSVPLGPSQEINQCQPSSQSVRKCLHCEITKTPQWRAGPMGPKTLCNACGVRYKSGRLFPEYRPAASPTFVPSLHSNSHKKVVEMRTKVVGGKMVTESVGSGSGTNNVENTQVELAPKKEATADCI